MRVNAANLNDVERVASAALGAGLLVLGLTQRKGRTAALLAAAGLLARGASGYCPATHALGRTRRRDDTKRALGGDRGVEIEETVTIARSASELYTYWRRLENLPAVFSHLAEVSVIDDRTSHWRIHGPLGTTFEWDAEIISDERPNRIAWKSLPGADIATAGSVHFKERTRGEAEVTEVAVRLQYDAPGGKAAHVLAWLAGQAPELVMREELRRLKQRLETGESPTGARRRKTSNAKPGSQDVSR